MTTMNLRLKGHITLKSPLAITQPGANEGLTAKDPQPVPFTTVYDAAMGLVDTAYLPASSFRGTLRRAGHDALNRRLRALGREPLDLRSFYMLRIGGIKSKGGDGLYKDVSAEMELRETNPFVSLFGAADAGPISFLAGRLEVDHGIPNQPIAPDRCPVFPGMRTDDMLRSPGRSMEHLPPSGADAWRMLFEATTNTSNMKKRRKALEREAAQARAAKDNEALEKARAELADIDDALSDATGSIAQPLAGYRAIPAGAQLEHAIAANRASLAEIGCLFDALDALSADPVVGGHRHHGCGKISGRWEVTSTTFDESGAINRGTLGIITLDFDEGLTISGDRLSALAKEAASAWAAAVESGDFAFRKDEKAENAK